MPQPPHSSQFGRLGEDESEGSHRRRAIEDPGSYHGDIAASELHWYDEASGAWLNRDPETGSWSGYSATDGSPVGSADSPPREAEWRPWTAGLDPAPEDTDKP